MSSPLNFSGESAPLGQLSGRFTLIQDTAFCISADNGDMNPELPHGLFFGDTRYLSGLRLLIDGQSPETLSSVLQTYDAGVIVARAGLAGHKEDSVLVLRRRRLAAGLRDEIVLHNFSPDTRRCRLRLEIEADFARLFDVKEGRIASTHHTTVETNGSGMRLHGDGDGQRTHLQFSPNPRFDGSAAEFDLDLAGKSETIVTVEITAETPGGPQPRGEQDEQRAEAAADRRDKAWLLDTAHLTCDDRSLVDAIEQSTRDIGGLRVVDVRYGDRTVLAAGAPWFMTLFGRDSILAAWMSLLVNRSLALSTVQVLADLQGTKEDARSEEQPGRILHEVRFGRSSLVGPGGGDVYYGTADATPLFVMLVGELARWGVERSTIVELLPHVDRALEWVEHFGDRDGDGFVEYHRHSDSGLANQGWKDSWDSISFADGRLAEPPIALSEVQGYVYAAYLARADLARMLGDQHTEQQYRAKAVTLKEAFNRAFWIDDRGWYAIALDADKEPVDALASNMGHCLWTGIVEQDRAADVARHLLSAELFSGWGVRTLACSMGRFDPLSYHNGSVWPHDSAIAVAGLMRYGFVEEAHRLVSGLLDASRHYQRHLPELFTGIDRGTVPSPVDYPSSSSPQAWAAASPLLMLRSLLRLNPALDQGRIHLAPALPTEMQTLALRGVQLGNTRIDIKASRNTAEIHGLPDGLAVDHHPLSWSI